MADKNLTLMLYKKDDLRLEERPIREPGQGQVQVEMRRVGICGSDVHFWTEGEIGTFVLDGPVALGHEGSAVVTKLGPGVTSLQVGDRVAIEPATPCRLCKYCKGGRYNLCPYVKGLATPGCDGHLTRYFVHDADVCHKLPENVSFEEGALMEPFAVAVHATNRAEVKCGQLVLICGAGPIGVLCMLMCKARGCEAVCITDVDDKRLEFAKSLGADHVINVTNKKPEDVAKEIEEKLGEQVDVTMECSGAPSGVNTAIFATGAGGVVVLVGMGPVYKELPVGDASIRELDIRGTFRYANSFPAAIRLVSSGRVDVKPLITHRYRLEDAIQAFTLAKSGQGVKVMINCDRNDKAV